MLEEESDDSDGIWPSHDGCLLERRWPEIGLWEGYKENKTSKSNSEEGYRVELAKAVAENNAVRLRTLLDQYGGIDFVDITKNTLLHYALRQTRYRNVVDVLLDTEGVPINAPGQYERTPLLQALRFRSQRPIRRLIERGADLNCRDFMGHWTLHYAVGRKFLELSLLLIERGIDVNCCDHAGNTPLFFACRKNWIEGIQMLLNKGADVNICNKKGKHPFLHASLEAREVLVDYVQHDCKTQLPLTTVIGAIDNDSTRLLPICLEYTSKILYDESGIDPCSFQSLFAMLPRCFEVFLAKFENDLRYFIQCNSGLGLGIFGMIGSKDADVETIKNTIENFVSLINSSLCSDFFRYCINGVRPEGSENSYSPFLPKDFVMSNFFLNFEKLDTDGKHKLAKLISNLVTEGVSYNDVDVGTVYLKLGHCSLFKQMISMEFGVKECRDEKKVLMPELIYDVQMSLDKFFDGINSFSYSTNSLYLVLDHFCDRRLKEFCSKLKDDSTDRKLTKLPQVPLLLELSRNVARKYIVDFYQIRSFPEFVKILNKHFVAKGYEQILTYERKLYDFL